MHPCAEALLLARVLDRLDRAEERDRLLALALDAQKRLGEGLAHRLTIEGNLFDHNGWNPDIPGAEATTFNQNVYLQVGVTGVVFSGNVSARAAGAGCRPRSWAMSTRRAAGGV